MNNHPKTPDLVKTTFADRMPTKTILALLLIGFLGLQSIAEAASISTRVRILESKVYKQGKLIREQSKKDNAYTSDLKKGLKEIELLRLELQAFMAQQEQAKKPAAIGPQGRYSYP